MKIQYVGAKLDGETAFKDETRITWYPGDENEVDEGVAQKMLKHPDVFARAGSAEAKAMSGVVAQRVADADAQVWKDRGTALGMTDGNIEAIAAHGGPETERGAALWLHYCGEPFAEKKAVALAAAKAPAAPAAPTPPTPLAAPAAPAPAADTKPEGVAVIKVGEGWLVLDAMEAPALHVLAKDLGVKVHHAAGAKKVIDALVASQKPAKAKK